jgi:hypothetical protein
MEILVVLCTKELMVGLDVCLLLGYLSILNPMLFCPGEGCFLKNEYQHINLVTCQLIYSNT